MANSVIEFAIALEAAHDARKKTRDAKQELARRTALLRRHAALRQDMASDAVSSADDVARILREAGLSDLAVSVRALRTEALQPSSDLTKLSKDSRSLADCVRAAGRSDEPEP